MEVKKGDIYNMYDETGEPYYVLIVEIESELSNIILRDRYNIAHYENGALQGEALEDWLEGGKYIGNMDFFLDKLMEVL